jgi:phosphoglycerate dehydrogenase-like enzyme
MSSAFHVPKNTQVLDAASFSLIRPGAVLINTWPTFEISSFLRWIEQGENYAMVDAYGVGRYRNQFLQNPKIILSDRVAGWTEQARRRLTRRILDNPKA